MLTGPQKSFVALILTTIGGIAAVLVTQIPNDPSIKLWGGIITGVVTVLATTLGVYTVPNAGTQPAKAADPTAGLE